MEKKEIIEYLKLSSFLIFIFIYVIANYYLGGNVDWFNFFVILFYVLGMNLLSIALLPLLTDYKRLKELDKKIKELQSNPFSALAMQEDLLKMMQEKQSLMTKYSLITMFLFLIGFILLFKIVKGDVWSNFKIELPFIGPTINVITFYILISLGLMPILGKVRAKFGIL